MEKVWHDHKVAINCKLIRNQLGINKTMTEGVCENQNSLFGGTVCGISDVGFDYIDVSR